MQLLRRSLLSPHSDEVKKKMNEYELGTYLRRKYEGRKVVRLVRKRVREVERETLPMKANR